MSTHDPEPRSTNISGRYQSSLIYAHHHSVKLKVNNLALSLSMLTCPRSKHYLLVCKTGRILETVVSFQVYHYTLFELEIMFEFVW